MMFFIYFRDTYFYYLIFGENIYLLSLGAHYSTWLLSLVINTSNLLVAHEHQHF